MLSSSPCCVHCHMDPGVNKHNLHKWNGFYDMDMEQHVCYACKDYHYWTKQCQGKGGFYSEFPVVLSSPGKVVVLPPIGFYQTKIEEETYILKVYG